MADGPAKADGAFRTIGELSRELGLAPHILRYWESRFPQLRPLTRAGGRRYYRAADIALVKRIDQVLNRDGYTIKGAQQLLGLKAPPAADPTATLRAIRDALAAALAAD
ncbi:MerR family transcriptional regulator [Sphingomonas bacterium]|uniref:MerR family transcriptional regulator n=1 Tax=Sphingomonas bacterium TaxID=1895847 RepID=UPI0015763F88|nr:MerR family transcriptional regulator [Sphingomonas bacterium]